MRSLTPAVTSGLDPRTYGRIGFLLVVEGLIAIVAPDAGPYLPGGTLSTLAAGRNDQLAWVTDESRSGL